MMDSFAYSPSESESNPWMYRKHLHYEVQYNRNLHKFGWNKLKEIAEVAIATCDIWDSWGKHVAETGSLKGVKYIAFPIRNEKGEITVCIETQESFEKTLGVKLSDIAETSVVSDGQHKHQGYKYGNNKS